MLPSKIFFFLAIFFILGIGFASFFKFLPAYFLIFAIPLFFFKREVFFIFISFVFGAFYFQSNFLAIEREKKKLAEFKEIEIVGIVDSFPSFKEKFQEFKIKIESLFSERKKFSGRILIRTSKRTEFEYGQKLKISGKINLAKEYLLKEKVLALIYFPKIVKENENSGNWFLKLAFSLKRKFNQKMKEIFPQPHFGLMKALIFGEEEEIPKEILEKLNFTQTRHICAVSGMNITLISILVLEILLFFGFWRNQAFFLTTILIFFYLLMIGLPASGLRAGIMGFLFLLSQNLGRLAVGERTLIFATFLILLFNPFLFYDLSFQLSFLATLGLIELYPIFLKIFKIPKVFQLKQTFCASLAAQLYTFPLLISKFGNFFPFFFLPNLLILPILPLFTFLIFFSTIFAFFFFPLAKFLSFSALFFSNYVLKVVDFFSNFPTLSISTSSFYFLLISFSIVFFFTFFLKRKFGEPFFLG